MKKLLLSLFLLCGSLYSNDEPCCYVPSCWWLDAEILCWKAFQGGMEIADSYAPLAGSLASAKGHRLDFDWAPGFRLNGGTLYESWDFFANYTYYYTRAKERFSGTLFPTQNLFASTAGGTATIVALAEGKWRLNFQYFDLEVGRLLCFGSALSLRPHMGLRGAWVHQKATIAYSSGNITSSYKTTLKNSFGGGGLKGGMEARYQVCRGGSLFMDSSLSLLYGVFHTRQVQNQLAVNQADLRDHFQRVVPVAQVTIGFSWDWEISWPLPMLVATSFAAEGQYWWRQNHNTFFTSGTFPIHVTPEYDLSLFGFNIRTDLFF